MNSKKTIRGAALAIIFSFVLTFIPIPVLAAESQKPEEKLIKQQQNQPQILNLISENPKRQPDVKQQINSKENILDTNENLETDKNNEIKDKEAKESTSKEHVDEKIEQEIKKNNNIDKSKETNIDKDSSVDETSEDVQVDKVKEANDKKEINIGKEQPGITADKTLVSLTEVREVKVKATFEKTIDSKNLVWTFGGKPFSQWKKWDKDKKSFIGDSFISFVKEPEVKGNTAIALIKFDLPYGTDDLALFRSRFHELLGNYDLTVKDTASGKELKQPMRLNVYDSYRKYDELKPTLDKIFKNARKGIYLEYQSIGKSVEGRDFHFVIMAKDKKSVDDYLNNTVPSKLNNPKELQEKLKNKSLGDYKVPIFINNIHPNEAPGIDAQLDALQKLTTEKVIKYNTMKDKKEVPTELDVDKLLDNVIILMNLTENPDGRYYNRRENNNGFDLNRDNCYQTQPESRNVISQIVKWNPITFIDLHGFVKEFLIEPCTPPHDPNYDYDLLINSMEEEAHAIGDAGIANTKFDSYIIPKDDYKYGWDDGGPAYTPIYAMHHGVLGHTVETPELNQAGCDNEMYALFGVANYVLNNKDKLFYNQLEYYRRGIEGIDDKNIDKWFVNQAGQVVGRPRGENKNFFPEYYVLPIDSKLQKNSLEVYNMVQYLLRNGIKVEKTTEDVVVNEVIYPKGTFIVNMHQAKRGLANTVLYNGTDVSDFKNMYAEIVVNFPALRGFDKYEVRDSGIFNKKTQEIKEINIPTTVINTESEKQIVKNTNNDVIKLINNLLNQGKKVSIITESGNGFNKGDFIVNTNDIKNLENKYFVETIPTKNNIQMEELRQPKVLNTGSKQSNYILRSLGFKLVNDPNSCDVIVDDEGHGENKGVILKGKDYIGIGQWALGFIKESKIMPGLEYGYTDKYGSHEGLLKGSLNTDNIINSGYGKDDFIYTANGAWISQVPKNAEILSKVKNDDDFYIAGWWPNHNKVKGQVMAITQPVGDSNITLFANTITNKDHTRHNYRQLANAILASVYTKKAKDTKQDIKQVKVLGVENNKVYDKPVKVNIEAPKNCEYTAELDGKPWDGKEINKEGKHQLIVKTKDSKGNEKSKEYNFEIKYSKSDKEEQSDKQGNKGENKQQNDQTNNESKVEINDKEYVNKEDGEIQNEQSGTNIDKLIKLAALPKTGETRILELVMAIGALMILVGVVTIIVRRKTKVK